MFKYFFYHLQDRHIELHIFCCLWLCLCQRHCQTSIIYQMQPNAKDLLTEKKHFFVVTFLKKYVWPVQQGREGRTSGRQTFRAEPEITIYWSRSITIIGTIYLSQITILIYLVNFSFNRKYCHNIFVSDFWQLCLIPPTFFLSRSKVMLSRSTTQTEKATDFRRVWNDCIF